MFTHEAEVTTVGRSPRVRPNVFMNTACPPMLAMFTADVASDISVDIDAVTPAVPRLNKNGSRCAARCLTRCPRHATFITATASRRCMPTLPTPLSRPSQDAGHRRICVTVYAAMKTEKIVCGYRRRLQVAG